MSAWNTQHVVNTEDESVIYILPEEMQWSIVIAMHQAHGKLIRFDFQLNEEEEVYARNYTSIVHHQFEYELHEKPNMERAAPTRQFGVANNSFVHGVSWCVLWHGMTERCA